MNYFGGKKQMKDERITRELNKTKLAIIYYVLITTTIVTIIKLLLSSYIKSNFFVEGFILLLGVTLLTIKIIMYQDEVDERIESSFDRIGNIFLVIMLFGGFFIHFFANAYANQQGYFQINFTSTFILIGFIVLLVQLKRRDIYLHFPLFFYEKKQYILKILKRIVVFGLIFSLNVIPYLIFQVNISVGILVVAISFLSLGFAYFFFALYERNHYQETEMLADGKIRKLTKNASLLYVIPLFYYLISIVFNTFYGSFFIHNIPPVHTLSTLTLASLLIRLWGIDISIIIILIFFIIRNHLKRLNVPNRLIKTINIYIISLIISSIISPIFTLGTSLLVRIVNDIELIQMIMQINLFVSLGLLIYFFVLMLIIAYQISKLVVLDMGYLYAYISLPILAYIINRLSLIYESFFLLILGGVLSFMAYICFFIFMKKQEYYVLDYSLTE